MTTLEEVRKEFPTANYIPDPNCNRCNGTGHIGPRKIIHIGEKPDGATGAWIEEHPEEGHQPCICLYVGDPAIRMIVTRGLKQLAAEYAESDYE